MRSEQTISNEYVFVFFSIIHYLFTILSERVMANLTHSEHDKYVDTE